MQLPLLSPAFRPTFHFYQFLEPQVPGSLFTLRDFPCWLYHKRQASGTSATQHPQQARLKTSVRAEHVHPAASSVATWHCLGSRPGERLAPLQLRGLCSCLWAPIADHVLTAWQQLLLVFNKGNKVIDFQAGVWGKRGNQLVTDLSLAPASGLQLFYLYLSH